MCELAPSPETTDRMRTEERRGFQKKKDYIFLKQVHSVSEHLYIWGCAAIHLLSLASDARGIGVHKWCFRMLFSS